MGGELGFYTLHVVTEIDKQVSFIHGELDFAKVYNWQTSFLMAHYLLSQKKELQIIPNAAHNLTLEAPEQYFGNVNSFLKKLGGK